MIGFEIDYLKKELMLNKLEKFNTIEYESDQQDPKGINFVPAPEPVKR